MTYLQDIVDRRYGAGLAGVTESWAQSEDAKKFPAEFPIARWVTQYMKYQEYWRHFTGEVWEEIIEGQKDANGDPVFRYPLKINYIKTIAIKHNQALWGETDSVKGPLVHIRVEPEASADGTPPDDAAKTRAQELENYINKVLEENNARILFREAGLISQFLGGIAFQLSWREDDPDLNSHTRLEYVLPDFIMPVWDTGNPTRLLEVFKVWRMPAREAELMFGLEITKNSTGQANYVIYVEHWTEKKVTITIDGKPIEYDDQKWENLNNQFGFTPFVYIPRQRAGSFYGLSVVDDLVELSKELNSRFADMGDIVNEAAHRDIYGKNITQLKRRDFPGTNRQMIELVGNSTITGLEPKVETLDPPELPEALIKLPTLLREQLMMDAFIPPVANGEDEGSQRSGLTLAFRMWSLTSTAETQRDYWTAGLIRLAKMIVKIAITNKVKGITPEHLEGVVFTCQWPSIMPRDREAYVNEVMLALGAGILSPITALEKLDMVADPIEEYKRLQEHREWEMQTEAKYAAKTTGDGQPKGNNTKLNEPLVVPGTKD